MNFYKHHIGDYDAATAHLTWLEDAAYRRLMCLYYRREEPIPADVGQACRLVRATSKGEREAVAAVLQEFFVLGSDGWRQDRCDGEIEAAQKKADANRTNGKNGGRPKRTHTEQEPSGLSVGSASHPTGNLLQTPDSREVSKPTASHPAGAGLSKFPPGFDRFWQAYPRKVGKDAAIKAFAKRRFTPAQVDLVIVAVEAQKSWPAWTKDGGEYIPHPATWLNEGRWEDEQPQSAGARDPFAGAM